VSAGNHPYTGAFTGCDNAILRFSAAQAPTKAGTTFGTATKCLRSGTSSATLLAMYSLLTVPDFNPFEHDFSNHPPALNPKAAYVDLPLQLLARRFATASAWPTFSGLSDLAMYDQNGNKAATPNFPYRLILHPTTAVHNLFAGQTFTTENYFLDLLAQVPIGTLYEIWAEPKYNSSISQLVKIGTIEMTTKFETSNFGDVNMFMEHCMQEQDVYYKPEWTDDVNTDFSNQMGYLDLPFFWDDLPWN